ncbi:MAG: MFS transporter [Dehalococcoidales bacterium]|nr:MFS transporter [Dehalococcoidales bacterium]
MVIAVGSQLSFGVFFTPMLEEFGWTRAATSAPFSLSMILSAVLNILSGRLSDRFGPRKIVSMGGLFLGMGMILTSQVHNLWQIYLSYGVLVAIGMGSMYVPMTSTLTRWFGKRRGLMAGIAISGIGLGIGTIPSLATRLIEILEWRGAFIAVGAANLILIIALAQLLKATPDKDQNSPESEPPAPVRAVAVVKEYSFMEAFRTGQFWMIIFAWIFYGILFQAAVIHIVPYGIDLGMSAMAASIILVIIGFCGIAGRISIGFSGDKFGNSNTMVFAYAVLALAFFGLIFSHTLPMLYIFALLYGFFSGIGILITAFVAERFGLKALGAITGAVMAANSLGGAIGPILAGSLFDLAGDYNIAFLLCGILGIVNSALICLLRYSGSSGKT